MKTCKKLITVDFDAKERSVIAKLFFLIRVKYFCETLKLKCQIMRSKKGIHVYIHGKYKFEERMPVRILLLDDPMRIEIDEERHIHGFHEIEETLFNSKCQKEYCYTEKEIKLEELEKVLFIEFSPYFAY